MQRREMKALAKQRFKLQYSVAVIGVLIALVLVSAVAGASVGLLVIFVFPIYVGEAKLFMKLHYEDQTDLKVVFDGFRQEFYLNNVLMLVLRAIFTFLWTLLLIIPGIIKHYAYAMVPFILADEAMSDDDHKNAITKSRELMNGHKFELFVIDLSFIGWFILSALTFGILYVLYVQPYYMQTRAIFYRKLTNY